MNTSVDALANKLALVITAEYPNQRIAAFILYLSEGETRIHAAMHGLCTNPGICVLRQLHADGSIGGTEANWLSPILFPN